MCLVLALLAAGALAAKADPLPDPPPKVLPDPSPGDSHAFDPSLATAGAADPGRKLAGVRVIHPGDPDCTALNPCALPPPSLERAPSAAEPG